LSRSIIRLDWLNPLVLTLLFVVIAASYKFLQPFSQWPVSDVRVQGKLEHTNPKALQYALAKTLAPGFIAADLVEVEKAVEQLPWVRSAKASRIWPEQLELHLVEKRPIANWLQNGLLDSNLVPFFPISSVKFSHLPKLAGPAGSEKRVWRLYRELYNELSVLSLEPDVLSLAGHGAWSVHIKNGPWILLGKDYRQQKISRLKRAYTNLSERWSEVRLIDLRYPNGFAVEWKQ
jgi:cell division protein FtsQ